MISIRTKRGCSFIPLSSGDSDKRNYAVYRFYNDPLGEMTLMYDERGHLIIESCTKEDGVWISRINKAFPEPIKEGTPEYEALEALLEETREDKILSN